MIKPEYEAPKPGPVYEEIPQLPLIEIPIAPIKPAIPPPPIGGWLNYDAPPVIIPPPPKITPSA